MKKDFLKEIVVWLLVFFGLLIFSVFAYIIGSNKGNFFTSIVTYQTILPESTGIYVGTKVTIHGKSTGNVIQTTLLPDGQVEARFVIRKNHVFSITETSLAQLKTSGALGDRYININTPDLSAKPLKKGSLIPYKESSTLLSAFIESGGDAKKSLQSIMTQIDGILGNLNKEGFGFLSQSDQKDLTQILKSTKNILKKVESGQGTLGALVNDRSLYNRLLVLLGQRPANYLQDLSKKSQNANN